MEKKYTENTKLSEILGKPGEEKIISKYRLPCLGCPMARLEAQMLTLGEVSKIYGIDLDGLLDELNKIP